MSKVNIAIFASGNGSNFEAIIRAHRKGKIKNTNIKLLVTDRKDAYVRVRARRLGVRDVFVDPYNFRDRKGFERHIVSILQKERVSLIVLAGFMRILTPYFVRKFKNRILNIHPALLPAFKGEKAIERAYRYGVKVSGVTVHFVDEKVDHGPIIIQAPVVLREGESIDEFETRIHRTEHRLYPQAINLVVMNKVKIVGRRVILSK